MSDVIDEFSQDSLGEIAAYFEHNLIIIAQQKYKENLLKDFQSYIHDIIPQYEKEVYLASILQGMKSKCVECANRVFDNLPKLQEIMAFSPDVVRDFTRTQFTEVIVKWSYEQIIMKNQTQQALRSTFEKVMNEEMEKYTKEMMMTTTTTTTMTMMTGTNLDAVSVFTAICNRLVDQLAHVFQQQYQGLMNEHGVKQYLEDQVSVLSAAIKNYMIPEESPNHPTSPINPGDLGTPTHSLPASSLPPSPVPSAETPLQDSTLLLSTLPAIPQSIPQQYTEETVQVKPQVEMEGDCEVDVLRIPTYPRSATPHTIPPPPPPPCSMVAPPTPVRNKLPDISIPLPPPIRSPTHSPTPSLPSPPSRFNY